MRFATLKREARKKGDFAAKVPLAPRKHFWVCFIVHGTKALFHQLSGYTTIIVALCFLFALTLVVIGIIGEYISILMQETKGRPIYIVRECVNLEEK